MTYNIDDAESAITHKPIARRILKSLLTEQKMPGMLKANPSVFQEQVARLTEVGCIVANDGKYSITKTGATVFCRLSPF